MPELILLNVLLAVALGGAVADRKSAAEPTATSLLPQAEAIARVGGPLAGTFVRDDPPTRENGHDRTTVRGWFPKGYDLANADAPPERGVMLQLHALPDSETAAQFLERTREVGEERASDPAAAALASRFARVDSLGAGACLTAVRPGENEPGNVHVATVSFAHGRWFAQLTVWRTGAPADTVAVAAARSVLARWR